MEPEGSLPRFQEPAIIPILSQTNPSMPPRPLPKDPSSYYFPIYSWLFLVISFRQVPPPKPCMHLSFPCATCLAYLILLDLMTRVIFYEQYRSLSIPLCSFLHSPVTSSLLGPNNLLSSLQTPSGYVPPCWPDSIMSALRCSRWWPMNSRLGCDAV
jgi:hypothetical protein